MILAPLEMQLAREFHRRLQELLGGRLHEVRLFGSRARGEGRRDSDLDVLVLLKGTPSRGLKNQVYDLAYDVAAESMFRVPLAPLVVSRERFEEWARRERRLAADIARDGIVL